VSYSRWSTDDFKCDLYVYANVSGKWTIHVAGNRTIWLVDLPEEVPWPPRDEDQAHRFVHRHLEVLHMMDEKHEGANYRRESIELPYAGETFNLDSPGEAADTVAMLRDLGYSVPYDVIDELRAEQADMDKGEDEVPVV